MRSKRVPQLDCLQVAAALLNMANPERTLGSPPAAVTAGALTWRRARHTKPGIVVFVRVQVPVAVGEARVVRIVVPATAAKPPRKGVRQAPAAPFDHAGPAEVKACAGLHRPMLNSNALRVEDYTAPRVAQGVLSAATKPD